MTGPDRMTDAEWWAHLCAPATWVYLCHVNLIAGVECALLIDQRTTTEFPTRATY